MKVLYLLINQFIIHFFNERLNFQKVTDSDETMLVLVFFSQLIKKLISLRLLFIYFSYAINNQLNIVHCSLPILYPCAAQR